MHLQSLREEIRHLDNGKLNNQFSSPGKDSTTLENLSYNQLWTILEKKKSSFIINETLRIDGSEL